MSKHGALIKLVRGLEEETIEITKQIRKDLAQIKYKIKIKNRNK